MGPRRITKKTTEKLVKAWRDALGCGDWHVEIHMAKIPEANESANSHFDDIRKRIDMVIDPFKDSTGKECRDGDPDRETDIVHEFIHVLEYPKRTSAIRSRRLSCASRDGGNCERGMVRKSHSINYPRGIEVT